MSEFLDNLKNAADNGEFNSEAAKKILEINELAEQKLGAGKPEDLEKIQESLTKRVEDIGVNEPVSEEKAVEVNTEYERKMAQFKKLDAVNGQLAMLTEIEDMVKLTILDMFSFIKELEDRFKEEFETEDPMLGDLHLKIESIENKYKSIIN